MYCGDETGSLVGDIGSVYAKFGYSGEDTPRGYFNSNVGFSTNGDGATAADGRYYLGNELRPRPEMIVRNPICSFENIDSCVNNHVTDWDVFEKLWNFGLQESKLVTDGIDHPVILTEPTINSSKNRAKCANIMFETFHVPALYISQDTVLTSFAAGRASSIVVQIGGSTTQVVAISDGYALRDGCHISPVGGRRLTKHLAMSLQQRGITITPRHLLSSSTQSQSGKFHSSLNDFMVREVIRDIKQSACRVPDVGPSSTKKISYFLPDKTEIDVSAESRSVMNLLFGGATDCKNALSIAKSVSTVAGRCQAESRKMALGNIVLGGGSSLFEGLPQRLARELDAALPSSYPSKVVVPSPHERRFSSWIGGSVLSALGTFQQMWISGREYEDIGESILLRRLS